MRRILAFSVLLVFLAFCAMASAGTSPTTKNASNNKPSTSGMTSVYKGKLELSDDFFDFGYTPQNAKVIHRFWVKNVGTDSLEIIRIKPG